MVLIMLVIFLNMKFLLKIIGVFPKKVEKILSDMLSYFQILKKNKMKLISIIILSAILWTIHMIQGYLIFWTIGANVGFIISIALIPIGILAGMIPITIAGMGTRDTAFVLLFAKFLPRPDIILFGIIFSFRYIIPALIGSIWSRKFINKI